MENLLKDIRYAVKLLLKLRKAGFKTIAANCQEDLTRDVRSTLWLLQGGALFVLLIGCVNIANLILVRATRSSQSARTRDGYRSIEYSVVK